MTSLIYGIHPGLVFKGVDTAMLLKPSVDALEEVSITCILWKAIHKLSIVQSLLPDPKAVWSHNYLSLPLRMTSQQRLTLPEDREPDHLTLLKQVQKCRFFLQTVLEEAVYELSYQGSCYFLEYVLCCDNLFNYDNLILKREHLDLNEVIRMLKDKLIVVRENFEKTMLYFSETTDPCLERSYANALAQAETVLMRTEFNQLARVAQNQYRLSEKENSLIDGLENCNDDIKEENKINTEVENHILFLTTNLQIKFDDWTRRYNREIDSLDIALLQLKSKLDEQKEQHQKLLEEYTERKEHLEILQEEADARDKEMELKRVQNKAATIIQEWWRRILFRRFIDRRVTLKTGKSGKKDTKSTKKPRKKRK